MPAYIGTLRLLLADLVVSALAMCNFVTNSALSTLCQVVPSSVLTDTPYVIV